MTVDLSLLTYNLDEIKIPKETHLNIFVGIGMWSKVNQLSDGLPIDVMPMLLSATIMRSKILQENPGKASKVIILIADSMAIKEGAAKEKVVSLVSIYKKSIEQLLVFLGMQEQTDLVCFSEIEKEEEYKKIFESLEASPTVQNLEEADKEHASYIRAQTATIRYMERCQNVGIKVGWAYAPFTIKLEDKSLFDPSLGRQSKLKIKWAELKTTRGAPNARWDEIRFDCYDQNICRDLGLRPTIQYLYTQAGLKTMGIKKKERSVMEGCPYTAFNGQRYIIKTEGFNKIKETGKIFPSVVRHWKKVIDVCQSCIDAKWIEGDLLLPKKEEFKGNSDTATVYTVLDYWTSPCPHP